MTIDNTDTIERWYEMMRAWPSDGWDGAAMVIASHAQRVREMEARLDRIQPDWRDKLDDYKYRPQTRDPR